MKLLLLGGNGFIGRTFIKNYHLNFEITVVDNFLRGENHNIVIIEEIGDISKKSFIEEVSKNFDCIINFAYDRKDLTKNFKIIDNITTACLRNKITKLIHISSISVYDPYLTGNLTENSDYSRLYDPYSYIKRKQEKILEHFANKYNFCEVVVLQPTIVYGEGGNWTSHANKEIQKAVLFLPDMGNAICNIVHVDEVCESIYKVVNSGTTNNFFQRYLISGKSPITWKDFYKMHSENLRIRKNIEIENLKSRNLFHDSLVKNTIYRLLFSKIGCYLILLLSKYIYKFKNEPQYHLKKNKSNVFNPIGINRLVHNSKFLVNSEKFRIKYKYRCD